MKLTQTKESVKKIEKIECPGADLILSLMLGIIDDVYDETGAGLAEMNLVTEDGDEEVFLESLDNVTVELTNVITKMSAADIPDELQFYADEVAAKKDVTEKLNAQVKQWKETAKQCKELHEQLSEETKKLEDKKRELEELKLQKAKLEKEVSDLCLTEEGCKAKIEELKKTLDEVPQSEALTALRKEKDELQMKADAFSGLLQKAFEMKQSDAQWKDHKFELVEEQYREDLETVNQIVKGWEKHLKAMITFAEELETKKENDYAGD